MIKLAAGSMLVWTLIGSTAAQVQVQSTSAERNSVEVTVYNSNMGLVKEKRTVSLPQGEGELKFMDVASFINPVTVLVKSQAGPAEFSVLEQNYEYDLISQEKLLDKYVGKKIKIIDWNEFKDRKEVVEAELLSAQGGEVYKIDNQIFLGHPGYKVLPELPSNLISRPTLSWQFRNKAKRDQQLEVSYLTSGLNWNADYVLAIANNNARADLSGWVTVDNQSGATYNDAQLKLIAGDVNRVYEPMAMGMAKQRMMDSQSAAPEFSEQAMFEYHMYDLQRKTTIKENQTKQISLLDAQGLQVSKEYTTISQGYYWGNQQGNGIIKQPVQVHLSFDNSKENKLGTPLPAGIVRIYAEDNQGKRQFVGEDRIGHTPKNEKVRIKAGDAFDIVAERVQTDFKQKTSQLYESEWEITVRNHKDDNISIGIIENAQGNWEIVQSSHKYNKIDANSFRFDVSVPKDKEVKVKYRLKVGI